MSIRDNIKYGCILGFIFGLLLYIVGLILMLQYGMSNNFWTIMIILGMLVMISSNIAVCISEG